LLHRNTNQKLTNKKATKKASLRGRGGRWIFTTTKGDGERGGKGEKKVRMQPKMTLAAAQCAT
jgi:hypothetical protein